MSRSWAGGSTWAYRKVRDKVLRRDGRACQIRLPGTWVTPQGVQSCLGRADCVHHTQGRAVTGDDPRFMVAACSPCNLRVGDPTKQQPDPPPRPRMRW